MSGVRCLQCDGPVRSTVVKMRHPGFDMAPKPTTVNSPCGHSAGLLFDFTEEIPDAQA